MFMSVSSAHSAKKEETIFHQGVFKTSKDYMTNKINPAEKINLNHLFSGHYINVIEDGKEVRYCKDSIFGYKDAKGRDYRFYKVYNDEYRILENQNMVIYMIFSPTHTPKGIAQPMMPYFYFSITLNSDILPLTIINLKKAYPDNLKFHDLLDQEFGTGIPLSFYDTQNKTYRVNYILSESLNNLK